MKRLSKEEAKTIKVSDACIAVEYPLEDKDINATTIEIKGRYPDKGRTVNLECKELAYVIKGSGKIVVEEQEYILEKDSVVLIDPGEKFYWEGDMTLFMPCTPAWRPEQHKEVD